MPAELSVDDTAGILDQIYRAAQKGLPRRFCCTPEQLKNFLHRKRLRTEFLDQVGKRLHDEHGIEISYPRSSRRNVGFGSWVLADSWQPASQDSFEHALAHGIGLDRMAAAAKRLVVIHRLNADNRSFGPPVTLTEQQLCEIAQVKRFNPPQWQELIENISDLKGADAVVFFLFGFTNNQKFAITHQFHLQRWFQPSTNTWRDASKRYFLEEVD